MNLKSRLMFTFEVSLFLTVFGFGLPATLDDVLYLFHRPGLLARSLVAMFVVMPVVVVVLVRVFDAPRTVEIVLLALAISPVPPLLPKRVRKAGAGTAYGLGLMTTAALLSIVIVPLWIYLLGRYFEQPFVMPLSKIAEIVGQAVFLPLGGGLAVRRILPRVADRIEKPVGIVAGVLLMAAVLVLVGGNLSTLWDLTGGCTLAMMAAFVLVGLATGHLLAEPRIEHEGVLALATAARHPGIALALANANYPGEHFAGTVLLYLLVSAIVSLPYMKWQASRAACYCLTDFPRVDSPSGFL